MIRQMKQCFAIGAAIQLIVGVASAQTAPPLTGIAGFAGSGIVTGGSVPAIGDVVASLRFTIGALSPNPVQVAALDMNGDGMLDLRDATLLLRIVVGLAPVPKPATPPANEAILTFETKSAWYDDHQVLYFATDDSDAAQAAQMNVNLAPKLSMTANTDAVEPVYLFYTETNGVLTAVPDQLPVFGSTVLEDNYTPLWQVMNVIVAPGYKANALTKDDDITGDKGPSAGGFVVRIDKTTIVVDEPIVFDAMAGADVTHPYVLPKATFDADGKHIHFPAERVLYDGDTYLMAGPDTSDPNDSKQDQSNLAPPLAKAGAVAIPIYYIMDANDATETQMPVLSAAPEPIGPKNASADYVPVWIQTTVKWSKPSATPPLLKSDDDVKASLASGDLVAVPGTFIFNCPIVEKEAAPSTPAPVSVEIQNFAFNPSTITVPVGTTVTWTNHDSASHTVTSGVPNQPDGVFRSSLLAQGKQFSFTFAKVGSFPYYCEVHTHMMATVIVK